MTETKYDPLMRDVVLGIKKKKKVVKQPSRMTIGFRASMSLLARNDKFGSMIKIRLFIFRSLSVWNYLDSIREWL